MKSLTRRLGVLSTVIAIAVLIIVGSCLILGDYALADTDTNVAYKYYYDQISIDPIAERFYKAFETLANNGEFKKGTLKYDLIANNVATKAEVEAYVNGADNNRLAKSFGMGRDAFYMDNPDLFYIDVFSVSISAGQQGGEYVGYLDSSRVLTMYRSESLNSESLINDAIKNYEAEIAKVVKGAEALGGVKEKIEYVNKYISENNTYGFGTKVEGDRNIDTPKADFIFTSYGALVNRESVCEGYAKSFKTIMDRLEIPCVCVAGYATAKKGSQDFQPHMWNYVQVEGMWYAVDVTYNSASANSPWILLGGQNMFDTHIEDGSVSSSGFELRYPALKPYNFGVDDDENGMNIVGSYNDTDDQGKTLDLSVSFEGKGALKLQEEGKYLAYSFGIRDGGKETVWSDWVNFIAVKNAADEMGNPVDYLITDTESKMEGLSSSMEYIKFALIRRAPDKAGDIFTGFKVVAYNSETLTDEDFITQPTVPYRNEGFGSYNPAPGAAGTYPSNSGTWPVDRTYDIKIVYNTKLELDAGVTLEQIELDFYTLRGNDTVKESAKVENLKWDGDKTITFTFTPSRMYIHNAESYYFTPVGLVGANSKKIPDPVSYSFSGKSVVCSKIFNDGRLYMNVFGQPNLLDNSDVSVTDFKDENGKYYAASQRSQLLLVASKPTAQQEETMDEVLKQETGVKDDEIMASSTYEINLQICGVVQKVPNGSYMQVAFGFPEGYSPDDAGTTFKIYHYKHDNAGNITGVEEIPVIVTEYGLIARVESFSPFTIVQIKNSSAAVEESKTSNVYAYVNGEVGGKITADGKSGISQVSDAIIYDITPDNGYGIACVRLNGKVIDSQYYQDGKLRLAKSDIEANNMLEVTFKSQQIMDDYAKSGFSIAYGEKSDFVPTVTEPSGEKSNNVTGIVIGCIVAVIAVVAIALAVFFVMKKKKEQQVVAAASVKTRSSVSSTSKAFDERPTRTTTTPSKPAQSSRQNSTIKSATTKSATTKSTATKSASTKSASKPTAKSGADQNKKK